MKSPSRSGAPLLFVFWLAVIATTAAGSAAAADKRYVCAPCGLPCDTTFFSAPGPCPGCGMALVEEGSAGSKAAPDPDRRKVAFLIFTGVEVIDFTGPYEMFGAAGCDVYTVAASKAPVTTAMGLTVVPKYSFADAPQPDVLVIPGGAVKAAVNDAATLQYIKDVTARTRHTMSVCNGAFFLASAGLLDGLSATTTNGNIPRLVSEFPKINVVRDRRYVDNGRIITTGGLSAGMDGALHVIENLFGRGYAQSVALSEEYDWQTSARYARAALADGEIPDFRLEDIGEWNVVSTEGDTTRWDIVVNGHSKLAVRDLMSRMEQTLAESRWKKVGSAVPGSPALSSTWSFTGLDGRPWTGTLKLEGTDSAGSQLTAAVSIARAG